MSERELGVSIRRPDHPAQWLTLDQAIRMRAFCVSNGAPIPKGLNRAIAVGKQRLRVLNATRKER